MEAVLMDSDTLRRVITVLRRDTPELADEIERSTARHASVDERAAIEFYALNPRAALFDLRQRMAPTAPSSDPDLAAENRLLRSLLSACAATVGGHVPADGPVSTLREVPSLVALAQAPAAGIPGVHSRA